MHHGHAIAIDMCFSMTWAAKEGCITEELRDRVPDLFLQCGLSWYHPSFTPDRLHDGTTTVLQRRDGDLSAAIPDKEIGHCRYINIGDFKDRAALYASLESALTAPKVLAESSH